MEKPRDIAIRERGYPADIQGDSYDLYISSFPKVNDYIGRRIGGNDKTLIEFCSGIGVGLFSLAPYFKKLVGFEKDPELVRIARKNVAMYGDAAKTTIKQVDITEDSAYAEKADVVIYDIPYWRYKDAERNPDQNPDLEKVVERVKKSITGDIVIVMPRETTVTDITADWGEYELQEIWVNGKHDRTAVYLGGLVECVGVTKQEFEI